MSIIERMQSCHLEQVCDIGKECFSMPWSLDGIKAELSNPHSITLVAIENNIVIGFLNVHCVLDEGYINNIAVTENYRRQGIGFSLINQLMKNGKKHNIKFFTLEVRKSNQNAIDFYKKQGFLKVGERKNIYEKPLEDAQLYTIEV